MQLTLSVRISVGRVLAPYRVRVAWLWDQHAFESFLIPVQDDIELWSHRLDFGGLSCEEPLRYHSHTGLPHTVPGWIPPHPSSVIQVSTPPPQPRSVRDRRTNSP